MFNKFKKKEPERLYKFTFNRAMGYSWEKTPCTLLVVARNTTDAVENFYKLTNNNVGNISEFTEIKLDGLEGIKADG